MRKRRARTVLRRREVFPRAADAGRWRALCRAAENGRPAAVDVLLDELRGALERGTAEERKVALDELLPASPQLWLALDRRARIGPARRPYAPHGEPAVRLPQDADPLRLVLASFDGDGRVRQAAVERLARRSGRFAVTALALRTDDWVPAVRDRAREALLGHVAPDEAASAVRMLARLGGRARSGGTLEEYRAVLREPERRRTVRRLAAEPDPRARRFGMGLALELGEYVRGDLARAALHDRDQVCRRLCAQALLDLDPDQAGRLMWARSAAVRELAVAALPDDVPAVRLVGPLADRSRTVRAQARWKLYKRGEPPVEVYRRQLRRCGRTTHPRIVAGLAAGLGECGDVSDLPALAVLARDDSWPAVARRAAVRATGLLAAGSAPQSGPRRGPAVAASEGGAAAARTLGGLAEDGVPSVAREALDALALTWSATPAVLAVAVRRPEPEVWRAGLRAVRTLEYFDRLEVLLGAAADPRAEVAGRARELLGEWQRLRSPGGTPAPERVARLTERLPRAVLGDGQRASLEFLLRALGRTR